MLIKNYITISLVACLLFSCDSKLNPEDNIPTSKTELITTLNEVDDTTKVINQTEIKTETIVTTEKENVPTTKPLLIARGSEPGWYAEFFKNKLRLLLNYGKDSVNIENNFSDIAANKNYKRTINQTNKNTKNSLTISIDLKNCTEEASGETRERTILIIYNSKTYKGCATIK